MVCSSGARADRRVCGRVRRGGGGGSGWAPTACVACPTRCLQDTGVLNEKVEATNMQVRVGNRNEGKFPKVQITSVAAQPGAAARRRRPPAEHASPGRASPPRPSPAECRNPFTANLFPGRQC